MSEFNQVFEEKLKHKGFFNFQDFYNFCYGWLRDEGYDVIESEYNEKITAGGKEIVLKWKAIKKVTDYFRNVIEINWRIIGLQDAEVERDGKKEKTNKGDLEMKFKGTLERDWEHRWESTPTYKFMRSIYDKYIVKSTTDQWEDKVIEKCVGFVDQIKAYLALEVKAKK